MMIKDDRGTPVELPGAPLWAFPRRVSVRLVGLRRQIELKRRPDAAASERLGLCFAAAVFVVLGVIFITIFWVISVPLLLIGLGLASAGLTRARTLRGELKRCEQQYEAMWARHPVCMRCRYVLAGLAPESDGCVVCPECGEAWALQRAGDPAQQGPREVG